MSARASRIEARNFESRFSLNLHWASGQIARNSKWTYGIELTYGAASLENHVDTRLQLRDFCVFLQSDVLNAMRLQLHTGYHSDQYRLFVVRVRSF